MMWLPVLHIIPQNEPGAVAQLDVRQAGMQSVAGSILMSGKTFFR